MAGWVAYECLANGWCVVLWSEMAVELGGWKEVSVLIQCKLFIEYLKNRKGVSIQKKHLYFLTKWDVLILIKTYLRCLERKPLDSRRSAIDRKSETFKSSRGVLCKNNVEETCPREDKKLHSSQLWHSTHK